MGIEDFRMSWQRKAEQSSSVCGREAVHIIADQEAERVHQADYNLHRPNTSALFLLCIWSSGFKSWLYHLLCLWVSQTISLSSVLLIVKPSLKLEETYESQSAQSHGNRNYYPYSYHVIVGFQSELSLVFSCFECILVWFLLSRFLFLYLHLNSVGLFVCIWGALGSLWKYMLTINAFMVLSKKGKAKVSNFFHNFVFFFNSNQQAWRFSISHQPSNLRTPFWITSRRLNQLSLWLFFPHGYHWTWMKVSRMKQDSLAPLFSDMQAKSWEIEVTLATHLHILGNVQPHLEGD